MLLAHVLGIPVEESLSSWASGIIAGIVFALAWLRSLGAGHGG